MELPAVCQDPDTVLIRVESMIESTSNSNEFRKSIAKGIMQLPFRRGTTWVEDCLNLMPVGPRKSAHLSECRSLPDNQLETNHTVNLNLLGAPSMYLLSQ
ncbi:hypothetical protein TNCV_4525271 [Trichonephila clavipes]|nr:hypothetical protein TNCV_4525271 [Trichonephila clavipes]